MSGMRDSRIGTSLYSIETLQRALERAEEAATHRAELTAAWRERAERAEARVAELARREAADTSLYNIETLQRALDRAEQGAAREQVRAVKLRADRDAALDLLREATDVMLWWSDARPSTMLTRDDVERIERDARAFLARVDSGTEPK